MSAAPVSLTVRPKINLTLHVTGKRADGYHLLDSLIAFPAIDGDVIAYDPQGDFRFICDGAMANAASTDASANLAARAAHTYFTLQGQSPRGTLRLTKKLPVGAGLGGGSADAAQTLLLLEHHFGKLAEPARAQALLSLGADVPVCDRGAPCRMQGIGEILSAIPPLPPLYIALFWPGVSSATQNVFARFDSRFSESVPLPKNFGDVAAFLSYLRSGTNDLSAAAFALHPEISAAARDMEAQTGCALARMSGSGACVFGLFETAAAATKAAKNLQSAAINGWTSCGAL